ncbi:MAG: GTP 3',8-cyclase MoaA [Terriglobales bacterium]
MRDSYGRPINDLRISVTDRCNYRCVYCRAGEGGETTEPVAWDDFLRLARIFVGLGIRKIRLTGGEPLLRPGLVEFVRELSGLGLSDLALTTNGHLLAKMAAPLRAAGLHRVTVSLDSVHADKFARITRVSHGFTHVLAGIQAAQEAGFQRLKINVVLLRGFNEDEVEEFAAFAREHDVVVRFIEFMPLEEDRVWSPEVVVTLREIVQRIERLYPLEQIAHAPSETARRYRFKDGAPGEIGVIAPVSLPFCGACSRIRLTADGKIRTCLFSVREWDLAGRLRNGADDAELAAYIEVAVRGKEQRHHIGEPGFVKPSRTMVHIGG